MWGVGNIMIIFLAAILDVPKHLHESAELDGANAFQRLRWVTLPTISPVILFAVVLGVIQALQYFTQAYVAASIAAGQASQAGTVSTLEQGYPEGSTLFYPVLLYYHGFRFFNMGYASAMAMLLLAVAFAVTLADRPELAPLGALLGSRAMSAVAAPFERRKLPRAVRRQRFLDRGRRAQPADRRRARVPRAGRLHHADGADDDEPGALARALAEDVRVGQLHRGLPQVAAA